MAGLGWLRRLFPVSCVFCYQDADRYGTCDACRDDLPQPGVVCVGCAEPLPAATASNLYCAGCQQHPPPWSACRAVLPYSWPVDVALQRLKFGRDLAFAVAFGEMLAALVAAEMHAVDALCPVPLHRLRQLRRGFN